METSDRAGGVLDGGRPVGESGGMAPINRGLASLARRLHALPGDEHRVTSALGVWLLLALIARAADDRQPLPALDEALGMPRADAVALADALMRQGHPAVKDAYAAWARADLLDGPLGAFLRALPAQVERGALPSQAEADAWASRSTGGLIPKYPVSLHPGTWITLASALATQVDWTTAFDLASSDVLGPGPFARSVKRVLSAEPGLGHRAWIAGTAGLTVAEASSGSVATGKNADVTGTGKNAGVAGVGVNAGVAGVGVNAGVAGVGMNAGITGIGPVAVHVAESEHLEVWSVSAAPEVPPAVVLDVAHALAGGPLSRLALADLPLGEGHSWTLTEKTGFGEDRIERVHLPAWEARNDLGLSGDPAFGDAGQLLASLLGRREFALDAAQSAMARYHQHGFEAAAVTGVAMRASAFVPERRRVRLATLRFAHPYAVVAMTTPHADAGAWAGIPVFSAWVAHPQEPPRSRRGRGRRN
ncbi:MAG: hypothetical protein QM708_04845 [Propioniciclava sp.]|uniref:hypothetical protein n=1 Tax=Propioniciclava sp. TaxID=2038686 RepID=UPI0039E41BE3